MPTPVNFSGMLRLKESVTQSAGFGIRMIQEGLRCCFGCILHFHNPWDLGVPSVRWFGEFSLSNIMGAFMKKVIKPIAIFLLSAGIFSASSCRTSGDSSVKKVEDPADSSSAATIVDDGDLGSLEQNIGVIKAEAAASVQGLFDKLGSPATRHFHPKGLCAKGKFIIDPDADALPREARLGPFAKKATYPMFGRFSNGIPFKAIDDRIPSVLGFGMKILDVSPDKFAMPGSTKPINSNQDWNLTTGRTFPIPTAAIYRQQRDASHDPAKQQKFQLEHPEVVAALEGARTLLDTVLATSYHSEVAFHWGEHHVAKFSVAPCDGVEKRLMPEDVASRTMNYLHEDFAAYIKTHAACFKFRAQIRPADNELPRENADWAEKYPSTNPTIDWPPSVIPFITLATVEFPAQPEIEDLQPTCANFSINPGNALQIFRPMEGDTLTESRFRGAYEGSVTKRASLNGLSQSEPTAPDVKNAATLKEWINAPR
jgi:hypothetical protein